MTREIRTILVVDSSASMLFYLGMMLRKLEYLVVTARTAQEAIDHMEKAVPSLVLTDIPLTGMNGVDLLKRIKDTPRFRAIPVVILTSEADPALKTACRRFGCAVFLVKPIEPHVLYRELQALTEKVPRENIRLATSLKVLVGDDAVSGGAVRTEYANAISVGGLSIRTASPELRNTVVPVTIFIQDRKIKVKAVVLYTELSGTGMKFVEIVEDDRDFIKRFIKEQITGDLSPQGRVIA